MIKTILWDVDRTLLDFDAAERAAIQSLFVEFGLGECSDEQVARYSVLNMKYWEKARARRDHEAAGARRPL